MIEKCDVYRRGVDVTGVLLDFACRCFSFFFFAPARCLCQATRFVLFIVFYPFMYTNISKHKAILLLFMLVPALEVDFGQIVGFVSTIIVFVIVAQFVLIFTIIAHHRIFDVGTDRIPAPL